MVASIFYFIPLGASKVSSNNNGTVNVDNGSSCSEAVNPHTPNCIIMEIRIGSDNVYSYSFSYPVASHFSVCAVEIIIFAH